MLPMVAFMGIDWVPQLSVHGVHGQTKLQSELKMIKSSITQYHRSSPQFVGSAFFKMNQTYRTFFS